MAHVADVICHLPHVICSTVISKNLSSTSREKMSIIMLLLLLCQSAEIQWTLISRLQVHVNC